MLASSRGFCLGPLRRNAAKQPRYVCQVRGQSKGTPGRLLKSEGVVRVRQVGVGRETIANKYFQDGKLMNAECQGGEMCQSQRHWFHQHTNK